MSQTHEIPEICQNEFRDIRDSQKEIKENLNTLVENHVHHINDKINIILGVLGILATIVLATFSIVVYK